MGLPGSADKGRRDGVGWVSPIGLASRETPPGGRPIFAAMQACLSVGELRSLRIRRVDVVIPVDCRVRKEGGAAVGPADFDSFHRLEFTQAEV
jgi:hypothetical protein